MLWATVRIEAKAHRTGEGGYHRSIPAEGFIIPPAKDHRVTMEIYILNEPVVPFYLSLILSMLFQVFWIGADEREKIHHVKAAVPVSGNKAFSATQAAYGTIIRALIRNRRIQPNEHYKGLIQVPDTPEGEAVFLIRAEVGACSYLWIHFI
jgi:hypothetical protein